MSEDTRREVTMESLQKSLMIAAEVAAQRVACMQSFEAEAARDWASVARDMTSALEEVRSSI